MRDWPKFGLVARRARSVRIPTTPLGLSQRRSPLDPTRSGHVMIIWNPANKTATPRP